MSQQDTRGVEQPRISVTQSQLENQAEELPAVDQAQDTSFETSGKDDVISLENAGEQTVEEEVKR